MAWRVVRDRWPLPGLEGDASTELPTPEAFARAAEDADEEEIRAATPMGSDVGPIAEQANRYRDAGFTHLVVHQIGSDPSPFFERVVPALIEQVQRPMTGARP
jgi:hypothetical protein